MVILNIKKSEKDSFLYKCALTDEINDVATAVIRIHNLRVQLRYCFLMASDLSKNNLSDKPDIQIKFDSWSNRVAGLLSAIEPVLPPPFTELFEELVGLLTIAFTADVALAGTGSPEEVGKAMAAADAAECSEDDRIRQKTVLMLLSARDVFSTPEAKECFDEETGVLWFCGKALPRERRLTDSLGKNENMKVVIKIGAHGAGSPPRESAVTDETQKAMMAYYFKKQEELKRISADEDIDYGSQAWANPRGLKDHFQGLGDIRTRG